MNRRLLSGLLPALFLIAAPVCAQAAQKVTLALNWLPGGAHAPLYYGQSAGIFRKAGLAVDFRAARGSREALLALGRGDAQFALAEAAEVFSQRAEGVHVVGIMAYFVRGASAFITLKRRDIQKIADLAGKTVGAPRASFPRLIFSELSPGPRIQWLDLVPAQLLPALIEGQVDAVAASTLVAHQYREAAAKARKEIAVFPFADAGVNPYGLVLVTTEALATRDAGLVKTFTRAVVRAVAASLAHPEEVLRAHLKTNPALGPARNSAEWRAAMALINPPEARAAGLGHFEAKRLHVFQALMEKIQRHRLDAPVSEVFTNRYLSVLRPAP